MTCSTIVAVGSRAAAGARAGVFWAGTDWGGAEGTVADGPLPGAKAARPLGKRARSPCWALPTTWTIKPPLPSGSALRLVPLIRAYTASLPDIGPCSSGAIRPATAWGMKRIFCPVCWATAFRESESGCAGSAKFTTCARAAPVVRTRMPTLRKNPARIFLIPGILPLPNGGCYRFPPSSKARAAAEFPYPCRIRASSPTS